MDAVNGSPRKHSRTFFAIFLTILSAFICRQLTKTEILPEPYIRPLGIIRSIIYIGLFFAWGLSLKRRIVHKQARRYLIGIDGLIIFWMICRSLKYYTVTASIAWRYLWYLYYLPMLFIPMCGVIIALTFGKPFETRISKKVLALWGITLFLFLLVITNDLHQKVFVFPAGTGFMEWDDLDYGYALPYYFVTAWQPICAIAGLFIMIKKCRVPNSRGFLLVPVIPPFLSILYIFAYWGGFDWFMALFGDITVTQGCLYVLTFELCIRFRLIASNMRYDELFRAVTGCSAQITDNDYNLRYSALDALPFDRATLVFAEKTPILLPDNRLLCNIPIKGGHAIWTEDESELIRLNTEIKEIKDELEERNSLLRYEYKLEKKRREVEEESRLYDLLQNVTQRQLDKIAVLIQKFQTVVKGSAESKKILAHIAVLCGFIKRRRHLTLLDYREMSIPTEEMLSAFGETMKALELLSVRGTCFVDTARLNGKVAALAYDFFEDCVEMALDNLKAVNVSLARPDGRLRVTVSLETDSDLTSLALKYPSAVIENYENEYSLILMLDTIGEAV